ncbi:MAG: hypothetical protein KJ687_05435 [Proteobacteria bacterium]|nr:hypothetical protein [Pseudomonadota bacterium]
MSRKTQGKVCKYICLTPLQLEFLETLSRCCEGSGGKKLKRSEIIQALIDVSSMIKIDLNAVKDEEQLRERICDAFRKRK